MHSKDEVKKFREGFWQGFKEHMYGQKSSGGYRLNWLNYPTKLKHVRINLFADNKHASVSLDFEHKSAEIRELHYEQLLECKTVMTDCFEHCELEWHLEYIRENGKEITRICTTPLKSSTYRPEEWPATYEYLEKSVKSMDKFWVDFGAIFDDLQS